MKACVCSYANTRLHTTSPNYLNMYWPSPQSIISSCTNWTLSSFPPVSIYESRLQHFLLTKLHCCKTLLPCVGSAAGVGHYENVLMWSAMVIKCFYKNIKEAQMLLALTAMSPSGGDLENHTNNLLSPVITFIELK